MNLIKSSLAVLLLIAFIWALNTRLGDTPPLGKLLSPTTGLWKNAESGIGAGNQTVSVKGIGNGVSVKYDKSYVPHVFAGNEYDLYFAQGYVTARDRLYQMDRQVRVASGTMAEVMGEPELHHDVFFRRLGLAYAAERSIGYVMKDPQTKTMLEAYTAGVNAYIDQLSPAEYPVEFKIYDYKPQRWKPVNSLLILKLVAEELTGGEPDFDMTNALGRFGVDTLRDLLSHTLAHEEPVVPKNTPWQFTQVPLPNPSRDPVQLQRRLVALKDKEGIGSNNWAIDGRSTASGYPMLANDPHLKLTLPTVWYQLQLQSPEVNVYGVSLPGMPGITIGFNNHIAWGQTNSAVDVVDWYRIKFKDRSANEYWYNGKWTPTTKSIQQYKVRNGRTTYDTIVYTHHGPVIYDGLTHILYGHHYGLSQSEGFAMRWVVHDVSNDLKTTYLLNRAKNYDDYRNALTYLHSPAQNFVFAGDDKNIAITCDGKFPLRYKSQGTFVLDGTDPADDWHGWIPMDQLPSVKNPERGFVSSANQPITDSTYPYPMTGWFASYARAKRINDKLRTMKGANIDSFRLMQTDSYSEMAARTLPEMLKYLDKSKFKDDAEIVDEISNWDYTFNKNSRAPLIYTEWHHQFYDSVWLDNMDAVNIPVPWPSYDRTVLLFNDVNAYWIDNIRTPQKETIADLVNSSFSGTLKKLKEDFGRLGSNWAWSRVMRNELRHIGRIPSFGLMYESDGGPNAINALIGGHGPSWRMVVEMGPVVKGYGALPGGQSGNPGSFYYDNLLPAWSNGKLNELVFLKSKDDGNDQITNVLTLKK